MKTRCIVADETLRIKLKISFFLKIVEQTKLNNFSST